jgi:hypothetical protein
MGAAVAADAVKNQKRMPLSMSVFHGQAEEFTGFHVESTGHEGPGIYFADRFRSACNYGTTVIEARIELANPYYFYPSEDSMEAIINPELVIEVLGDEGADVVFARLAKYGEQGYGYDVMDKLKSLGFDGLVAVHPFGTPVIPGTTGDCVILAFDATPLRLVKIHQITEQEQEASMRVEEQPAPSTTPARMRM